MSGATHTPGPWIDGGRAGYGRMVRAGSDAEPRWIAVVYGEGTTPEFEANARLIAAAPELLVALKGFVHEECPIVTHHRPDCLWCAALRVIAKAEGRGEESRE